MHHNNVSTHSLETLSNFNKSRILVVDDASLNRELIHSYLECAGYLSIDTAEDGRKALEKIDAHIPDIIILDLIMPEMGGLDVIKILRKNPKYKKIPIIVQTAISQPEQRMDAWSAGANDIITKPIHRLELLSRVHVQLKNLHMLNELGNYQKMAQTDIQQALQLQETLLPTEEFIHYLEKKHTISIRSIFSPCRFLSGDIWGIYDIDDHRFGVWICDFSGKGIRAALNVFRLHTLLDDLLSSYHEPQDIMVILAKKLSDLLAIGQFATFLLGIVDTKAHTFTYSSASAPHPIFYTPENKTYTLGNGTGVPLGVSASAQYSQETVLFNPKQSLVLYSDLLWEDKSIPGINFREEHLPSFIQELNGTSIFDAIDNQLNLLGNIQLEDDLTLVEIHFKGKNDG
jgi:sigma-B regulation protein RsbU (phosphoserine phosphatase)